MSKKKDFSKPSQSAFGSSGGRKLSTFNYSLSPGPGAYSSDVKSPKKENINTAIFKS
jgi:hypothetical protein